MSDTWLNWRDGDHSRVTTDLRGATKATRADLEAEQNQKPIITYAPWPEYHNDIAELATRPSNFRKLYQQRFEGRSEIPARETNPCKDVVNVEDHLSLSDDVTTDDIWRIVNDFHRPSRIGLPYAKAVELGVWSKLAEKVEEVWISSELLALRVNGMKRRERERKCDARTFFRKNEG